MTVDHQSGFVAEGGGQVNNGYGNRLPTNLLTGVNVTGKQTGVIGIGPVGVFGALRAPRLHCPGLLPGCRARSQMMMASACRASPRALMVPVYRAPRRTRMGWKASAAPALEYLVSPALPNQRQSLLASGSSASALAKMETPSTLAWLGYPLKLQVRRYLTPPIPNMSPPVCSVSAIATVASSRQLRKTPADLSRSRTSS